jgi:predicted Zn-dependent protease
MSDSAIQVFTNLVRRYPEIPSVRYHYAMALLQKGENAKAQSELSKALANKPSSKEEAEIRSLIAKIS